MRFSVENTCDEQVIKCKVEPSIFAEGTDILAANFAFIIIGHGFGGRFRGLVSTNLQHYDCLSNQYYHLNYKFEGLSYNENGNDQCQTG